MLPPGDYPSTDCRDDEQQHYPKAKQICPLIDRFPGIGLCSKKKEDVREPHYQEKYEKADLAYEFRTKALFHKRVQRD